MNTVPSLVLIVIAGPQASGKSTVAAALSLSLRQDGERVALVELDQIAAMALPTMPEWATAHRIFESVTHQWMRSGMTCVVAEGSGTQREVLRLAAQAPPTAAVVKVAVTVPFAVAFERARRDTTRGMSRERDFLEGVYQRWTEDLRHFERDVLLDTSEVCLRDSVDEIRTAITGARYERGTR